MGFGIGYHHHISMWANEILILTINEKQVYFFKSGMKQRNPDQ